MSGGSSWALPCSLRLPVPSPGFCRSCGENTTNMPTAHLPSRRSFLWHTGGGLGGIALAYLLGRDRLLADEPGPPAKPKRVFQLLMNGGASQMDTFDYKPELEKRHGETFNPGDGVRVEAVTST